MEPSKVRALDALMEDSNFSPGPTKDLYELRNQRLEEERRKTISTSTLKRRHDERIEALMESEEDEYKLKTRLSLPVEALVGRTEVVKRLKTTPTVAPSPEMKEHIKARFSIGNKVDGEDSKERLFPSISISSSSSQSSQAPLRRKRRLTGNVLPKQNSIQHIPSSSPSSTPLLSLPTLPLIKPNIVFSSLTPEEHTKYSKIVQKLGTFEIAIEVNDRTTHVITGKKRYTKATLLGLVKGLWLLNPEWLSASEKAGKYLREEEYERVEWYPRIEMARKGLSFIPTTSRFKVSSNVGTGPAFIESLIKQAGGNVVKEVEEANLVISNEHMDIDTTVVSEKWVFDSIEQWIYLSTDTYTI
ncbi:hypothetical protein G6F56_006344 [Rhizopus delemar]|nr:hypothetical protein G6F56_006344 [Rhizopus delemar]